MITIPAFSQPSKKILCDSLRKMIPTHNEILTSTNDSLFWNVVRKVSPIVDSLYIDLHTQFNNNYLNVTVNGIVYNYSNIDILIEKRLLDTTSQVFFRADLPEPKLTEKQIKVIALNNLLNDELKKLDTVKDIENYVNNNDVVGRKIDSLNIQILESDTLSFIRNSVAAIDKFCCLKSPLYKDSLNTSYDELHKNKLLNSFSNTLRYTHKIISNKYYRQELDILVANLMSKHDRSDLMIEWLTRYVGDKIKSKDTYYWMKSFNDLQVLHLLDKSTRWNPETRASLYYDLILDIPEPKEEFYKQYYYIQKYYAFSDYFLYILHDKNMPNKKRDLVSETSRLDDALASYKFYSTLNHNVDTGDQVLPLMNVGASCPYFINNNRDTISLNSFKILHLLKKSENLYKNDVVGLFEILDKYLLLLVSRNEIKRAYGFLLQFIKTRRSIRTTPDFFNYLLYSDNLQAIFYNNDVSFLSFMREYEKLIKDTSVSRSNIQVLLSEHAKVLARYYSNKYANSDSEFLSFEDSSNYYFKKVYDFDLAISSVKSKTEKERLMYEMNNEIEEVSEKRDVVQIQLNNLNNEYSIQNEKNILLGIRNKKLVANIEEMRIVIDTMKADTARLVSEKRDLSETVGGLAKDTASLNNEKNILRKENISLKEDNGYLKKNNAYLQRSVFGLIVFGIVLGLIALWLGIRIKKLNKHIGILKVEKVELEKINIHLKGDNYNLSVKNNEIQKSLEEKQKVLIESENKIKQNLTRIAEMNNTIFQNQKEYEESLNASNALILKEYSVKHEIIGILNTLHSGIKSQFEDLSINMIRRLPFLGKFVAKLGKVKNYVHTYYQTLENSYNNILSKEILLVKEYVDFVEVKNGIKDVSIKDNTKHYIGDVELPHHILNNFVKNSIEKGFIENEKLHIDISDKVIDEEYQLIISDDGRGVGKDFDLNKLPKTSTGFKNIFKQIAYYNNLTFLQYRILFDSTRIINRFEEERKSGTKIILSFIKK